MKWRDYVIEALENLGGRSHLELIYKEVERLRSRDSLDAPHLMEQVRRELETHSSSSLAYNPKYDDLFINLQMGKGVWELKNMFEKGKEYKRIDLHEKYGGPRQRGIVNCPNHPIILIFSSDRGKDHGYKDGWDKDKYFWYSGEGQKGDMTFKNFWNKLLRDHVENEEKVFLFKKTKKKGYWEFIDQLKLVDHQSFPINWEEDGVKKTRQGIQFKFTSVTYASELKEDNKKQYDYNDPGETERKGLVTTRIGQGPYRRDVLEKWGGKCGVTGSNIKKVLIASHIVPWSKSDNRERKDVENGILLSPNIDALFDRHLISFKDSGDIIIPNNINQDELENLGIHKKMKLSHVSEGMKTYISRHRETFLEKNK